MGEALTIRLSLAADAALRAEAERRGVTPRSLTQDALERKFGGALSGPETPPKAVPVVKERAEPAPQHVHTFVRHAGESGLFVWTCDCGVRRMRKPVS